MKKLIVFAGGVIGYLFFLATFLYTIGFVGNLVVPKSIDVGPDGTPAAAVAVDIALITLFGVQHSVMARRQFKKWWTGIVPKTAERSTYVVLASLSLVLLFWQWRPLPAIIWDVENEAGRFFLWGLFWFGWVVVFTSTFLIDHARLFGLRQVTLPLLNREDEAPRFQTPGLYKFVRHPMMTGLLIAFWATPRMTAGHMLFAAGMTLYMVVGLQFEERDLLHHFGDTYRRYRRATPMLIPGTNLFKPTKNENVHKELIEDA
ncbi:MAG: isoprenylcysteine carboxylmethyltransferase family protein [Candidatus Promineifilaceae bacterium]|nr:isoprenylcysteine carboxylmethyltransferase family protein [Candidatus Promineifilaceae bacterium]